MDYQEEQKNEIEALESIYYGDFEILAFEPLHKFSIPIKTEEFEPETENGLSCDLVITYTPKYPEEAPIIELENFENFDDEYEQLLLDYLNEQIEENLGMVMVFTLVSSAQEWLNVKWEEIKKEKDELVARRLKEEEEAELKRFEGTKVTVETFMKWKKLFEDELGITKKRELLEKEGKKLTGRELFMTDNTLNESDLQFLDEGDAVKVDESLFQDMDDLDIDEEDEDDEDFDPDNYRSDSSQ
ncbi:RWD domain-containing protein 1 [Diabrotica virgifera virgifera]|uniref:RWD domain-containing protein 1 n=1 Tax=Diabrotica virgifera virgifera TaxID=50390 RepID=A0A6P7F731_DIAVI|nr:RWD domain-containing protein 1 [Diabrotica virgifera virgifera]